MTKPRSQKAALSAALFASLAVPTSLASADVRGITLAVNGVVCPVCAHSVNMGLRRVEGVKSVKVQMGSHVVLQIALQPRTWVDPRRLFQQISLVGYRARQDELTFRVGGTVTLRGDHLLLTLTDVTGDPVEFLLVPGDGKNKKADEIALALQTLRKAVETNGPQNREIEGLWRPPVSPGQPASLLLTRVP